MKALLAFLTGLLLLAVNTQSWANEKITIGVISILTGKFTVLGEDAVRGFELAIKNMDRDASNNPELDVVMGATDGTAESAAAVARELIEEKNAQIIIGPVSGAEGLALKELAAEYENITFVNGIASDPMITLENPQDNYFRFNTDAVQWSAGLGNYVYDTKGWEKIVTIVEDHEFAKSNLAGFTYEYCKAGGEVLSNFQQQLGNNSFEDLIAQIPAEADAIYLGLGGFAAIDFLEAYRQADGEAGIIGGSLMVDGALLSVRGDLADLLEGTPSAGSQTNNLQDRRWLEFVNQYREGFPAEQRFPVPSPLATGYYNAANAVLQCVGQAGADLGEKQNNLRDCLTALKLEAPNGNIRLDSNRQAIGENYVYELEKHADGTLSTRMVKRVEEVSQSLGADAEAFAGYLTGESGLACSNG